MNYIYKVFSILIYDDISTEGPGAEKSWLFT